jgi:hypothetical protein
MNGFKDLLQKYCWAILVVLLVPILIALSSCSKDEEEDFSDALLLSVCIEFEGCDSSSVSDSRASYSRVALDASDSFKGIPRAFGLELCWSSASQDTLVVTPALPTASDLIVELRTQEGALLETLTDGIFEAGFYSICRDAGSLPDGIYSVYMEAGDYNVVRQFRIGNR